MNNLTVLIDIVSEFYYIVVCYYYICLEVSGISYI